MGSSAEIAEVLPTMTMRLWRRQAWLDEAAGQLKLRICLHTFPGLTPPDPTDKLISVNLADGTVEPSPGLAPPVQK